MSTIAALALVAATTLPPLLPPAEYDRPHPNMRVWVAEPDQIDRECRKWGARSPYRMGGCAQVGDGRRPCKVILPRGYTDAILRHEQAHCNGWEHK